MKTLDNRPFTKTTTPVIRGVIAGLIAAMAVSASLEAAPGGNKGGKGGDGSNKDIPVVFSFDTGGKIRGDGDGTAAYTHKDGRVQAIIRTDGHLDLNTHNGGGTIQRKLHVDLSDVVTSVVQSCGASGGFPDYNCNGTADDPAALDVDGRIFTLNDSSAGRGEINLRTLQPGATDTGGLAVQFTDSCGAKHVPWRIRFLNDQDINYPPCGASTIHIKVEAFDLDASKSVAPDNAADTWQVFPADTTGQASLFSGGLGQAELREIVRVPFIMYVTLK